MSTVYVNSILSSGSNASSQPMPPHTNAKYHVSTSCACRPCYIIHVPATPINKCTSGLNALVHANCDAEGINTYDARGFMSLDALSMPLTPC